MHSDGFSGFIKIHRSLLDWEWHDDANMLSVFIHCLMMANWKDGRYHGQLVPRGSFITSNRHLSQKTGLSPATVNRCLHRLQETGEIELNVKHFYTIVSVRNYAVFQDSEDVPRDERETQMKRKRNASETQVKPIEESKNSKKVRNIKKNTKRKRNEILPEYWNPNPIRDANPIPATQDEIEEIKQKLKGESKEDDEIYRC